MIPSHTITEDCSELTRELVLDFPICPEAVLVHAIRRAFSTFCEKSHFWHMDLDVIQVEEGVTTYDISAGNYFILLDVKRVVAPDGEVKQSATDLGIYARWDQRSMDSIDLYSIDAGEEVTITAAVKPREYNDVFKFSSLILTDYRDTILDGARARLFKMPKKEWTDLQLFQFHESTFNSACDEARRRQADSFSRLGNRVTEKARPFF